MTNELRAAIREKKRELREHSNLENGEYSKIRETLLKELEDLLEELESIIENEEEDDE